MPSSSESSIHDNDEETEERLKRGCESFFAMKGAALVLPHSKDSQRPIKKHPGLALLQSPTSASVPPPLEIVPSGPPLPEALVGELQDHLQSIFWILRPDDTIKMAVRLETTVDSAIRYMVLVSCLDTHQHTEETIILGVDILGERATFGLVLPIWADTYVHMGGDGGFTVVTGELVNIFKPVSIQAMWSALQALYKACDLARTHHYLKGGLHMTWTGYYESRIESPYHCMKEWHYLPDIISPQSDEMNYIYHRDGRYCPSEDELIRRFIFVKLKEVMIQSDLEEVTCKQLRQRLEAEIDKDLSVYRQFIDKQILTIYGQLDSASQIFDHIYLGSEWNASNLEELEENGVGYILNITKECDNFFPDLFQYCNIRLYDCEVEDLLRHWDTTNRFLAKAKEAGSKALVHCKMGISRSASTVIAYAMKEYGMSLDEAMAHVNEKRPIIRPNKAFMQQLKTYEGILNASRQRHKMFPSKSASSLSRSGSAENLSPEWPSDFTGSGVTGLRRNKSWCSREQSPSPDSPEGAVGGPSFYIGPDPSHLGAGNLELDKAREITGDDTGCSGVSMPVPSVRPSSIVKQQKEGTLAPGEVPFLAEQSVIPPPTSSTVLSSEATGGSVDGVQASSADEFVLNTNNNSANEASLDGSEGEPAEKFQNISVKSKVTEIESSVVGIMEPQRGDGEDGEESEGWEDSAIGAYEKESIPWNPGTVLRQKQEIEGKMKDGSPTSSSASKVGAETEKGDAEDELCEEPCEEPCKEPCKDDLVLSDSTAATTGGAIIGCSSSEENPSDASSNLVEETRSGEKQVLHGSGQLDQCGHLGSCNSAERAGGCAPSCEDESDISSNIETATVYTTSGEQIQLSMGLVSRHKREFEQKTLEEHPSSEVEDCKSDAEQVPSSCAATDDSEPCGVPEVATSEMDGECHDEGSNRDVNVNNDEACHETAYPEEGSAWKVGDVRRHTMELEERMELASSSPTKKAPFDIGGDDDGEQTKLTDDELRKIKDLEKIELTVSSQDLESQDFHGAEEDTEVESSEGLVKVADQVRKLELKRCASIAKLSNEKVQRRMVEEEGGDKASTPTQTQTQETPCEASAAMRGGAVAEASPQPPCGQQPVGDEPLVKLNTDHVTLFASQLGGNVARQEPAVVRKKGHKSESDKDSVCPPHGQPQSKRQHGPSHPLHKLGRGGGAGRGGSNSRGKFYSTM